jgi:glycyl-tRNA synthetase (class II)
VTYDEEKDAGRRYRRQDALEPRFVTVDHQTIEIKL